MRLRYLHFRRCGPLSDTAVVFGREDLIAQSLNLPRKGSLNFVVGVNGSGKSSLLRALYRIFRSLNRRERPDLPVTLAWDRRQGTDAVTAILHYDNVDDTATFFATLKPVPTVARRSEWEAITAELSDVNSNARVVDARVVRGSDALTSSLLAAQLPKRLIAYTSGADGAWLLLDHPIFRPQDEGQEQYQREGERPPGWDLDKELEEEQPARMANLLTRFAAKAQSVAREIPSSANLGAISGEIAERLQQELAPLGAIREKLFTNRASQAVRLDDICFRIQSRHLRYAGITLGLWQAAKEMDNRTEISNRDALGNSLLQQRGADSKPNDARRVLNEIDWFWPTHLALTYRDDPDRVSRDQHSELLCLVALADEVIEQPRGRQRAVLSLGPSNRIGLSGKFDDAFFGIPSLGVERIAKRVDDCRSGAEAVLRVFSADQNIDSTPMDVFNRLRDWERTGLLEDITLTIKRLHRPDAADGEPDDIIVTYDQLSDGEQMLLGRMGLLFLLRGQDGSLLLLDEPETHFNDVWKREIVDMIDMGLLNSTEANVIVATHTSIALTDAFAAEVTVLDKTEGHTTARGVTGGLFGTDPGEVNMNLFRADSSTGSRSVEILDRLLKTEWKGRENELDEILKVLGSSFHRAELRAILKKLRANNDGASSA